MLAFLYISLPTNDSSLWQAFLVTSSPKSSRTPAAGYWPISMSACPSIHRWNTSKFLSLPSDKTGVSKRIRGANRSSYFAATTSHFSTQTSKVWHDQDPDLRAGTEALSKEEIFWTCSSRTAFLDRGGRKTRCFFDVSPCKVEYVLSVISHLDIFNDWRVTRI